MKAISCPVILTSIRTKSDGALGLSFATPELTTAERVAWMDLHGKNAKMLLEPLDSEPEPPVEVKKELETKTCSQRLRATLFVFWTQQGKPGEFQNFYESKLESIITQIKNKLDP